MGISVVVPAKENGKIGSADRKRIKEAKAEAERKRDEMQATAAARAQRLLKRTKPLFGSEAHPYLTRKGVTAYGALRLGTVLVIPIYLVETGQLISVEFIQPNGTKRFLSGGRVSGGYFPIAEHDDNGNPPRTIIVVEGFATGASVFAATHLAVAVAFNAGNLTAVAKALRQKYPKATITIAADDDRETSGNPGLTAARAAALAVGGSVAIPKFANPSRDKTDFNDLALAEGFEAVAKQVTSAFANGIPFNFELTKHGLFLLRTHKNKQAQEVIDKIPVCSPIYVDALTRDSSGCEWGRVIRLLDPDDREHIWSCQWR